jgi:hypothetical protein
MTSHPFVAFGLRVYGYPSPSVLPLERHITSMVRYDVLVARVRGSATASLNQLARESDEIVLLEARCEASVGTPARLARTLMTDPATGLARASRNQVWNEQGCFPGASAENVETTVELVDAAFRRGRENAVRAWTAGEGFAEDALGLAVVENRRRPREPR